MPKRNREGESKEDKWLRKMKRYEDKLKKAQCYQIVYSEDEDDVPTEDHLEDGPAPIEAASVDVPPPLRVNDEHVPCDTDAENIVTPVVNEIENLPAPSGEPVSTDINKVVDDFDTELLKTLGEFETETIEWGENMQEDVAKRFQHTLQNGLKKEAKEELSKAPTLNPEVASMLNEASKNRDKRLLSKQDQLGRALSALGKAMTILLRKSPDIPEVLRTLNDAGKLFSDAHFTETDTRRALITPLVDKSLIDTFKDRKRDDYLFGDKLGDLVKTSRGIKKTGQFIQANSSYSSSGANLNWRAQSSSSRARQRPNLSRNGAHRYSTNSTARRQPPSRRQTGAFVPPAPTTRRQPFAQTARPPPPPPPPPPQPARHQT